MHAKFTHENKTEHHLGWRMTPCHYDWWICPKFLVAIANPHLLNLLSHVPTNLNKSIGFCTSHVIRWILSINDSLVLVPHWMPNGQTWLNPKRRNGKSNADVACTDLLVSNGWWLSLVVNGSPPGWIMKFHYFQTCLQALGITFLGCPLYHFPPPRSHYKAELPSHEKNSKPTNNLDRESLMSNPF